MSQFEKLGSSMLRSPAPVQAQEDELDISGVFRLLRRRITLIVVTFLILTLAALPSILARENKYSAQSRLLLQRPLTTSLAPTGESLDPLDLDTEIQRLMSREVALRVIDDFGLAALPEFNPDLQEEPLSARLRASLRGLVDGGAEESDATAPEDWMEPVVDSYFGALTVQRNMGSPVVEIGFSSLDPQLAADVPNALVRIYLQEREKRLQERLSSAGDWVDDRVAEQRKAAAEARAKVDQFRQANGLTTDARANADRTITTLNQRRDALAQSRSELSLQLSELTSGTSPLDAAARINTDSMIELRRELQTRSYELSEMLATFGEAHSSVVEKRRRVREVEAAIGDGVANQTRSLELQLASIREEDRAIGEELSTARKHLARLDTAAAELTVLTNSAERQLEELNGLEQTRDRLQTQGELPIADVEVLSPAVVPIYPVGRGRAVYLLIAMVAAGGIAVTAAAVRELFDRGIRSPQELAGIPGVVPGGMLPKLPARNMSASYIAGVPPRSLFADGVRGLLLAVNGSNLAIAPRSFAVTSAYPDDGKTVLATAVALGIAATGRRTLLVDGDLRGGRLHQMFGVPDGAGLAEILEGRCDPADVVHHDPETGIDFITRGTLSSGPYPDVHRAARIVQFARENDQLVVFDTAPVLATAEASVLASITDRTLLVVRWGRTKRHAVEHSVERLRSATRDDITVVVNMVDPKRHALYGFKDSALFSRELRKYHT